MKLIVGLGNPGEKYARNRHNTGFLFLDYLQKKLGWEAFQKDEKFEALLSSGNMENEKVILTKPLTYMNESGRAVSKLLQFYKLESKDILVVHDELDIEVGKYKKASNSRSAGHNGVQNIIDTLGTQEFSRLRVGISRPARNATQAAAGGPIPEEGGACISTHDYVLQNFLEVEEKAVHALFPKLEEEVLAFLQS